MTGLALYPTLGIYQLAFVLGQLCLCGCIRDDHLAAGCVTCECRRFYPVPTPEPST